HDRALDRPPLDELAQSGYEEACERGNHVAGGSLSAHPSTPLSGLVVYEAGSASVQVPGRNRFGRFQRPRHFLLPLEPPERIRQPADAAHLGAVPALEIDLVIAVGPPQDDGAALAIRALECASEIGHGTSICYLQRRAVVSRRRHGLRAAQQQAGRSSPEHVEGAAMDVITWLIVGLVAGVLASFVMGGIGYGIIGDIIVGIVGAVLGGFLFRALGLGTPFAGIAGTIFVAFIGAVVLLLILRAIRRPRA